MKIINNEKKLLKHNMNLYCVLKTLFNDKQNKFWHTTKFNYVYLKNFYIKIIIYL